MSNKPRKIISEQIDEIYEIGDNIDNFILRLEEIKERAIKKGYDNIYLSLDSYESASIVVEADREETDEEFNKRINSNKKRKESIKQREINELKRLAKKHPNVLE